MLINYEQMINGSIKAQMSQRFYEVHVTQACQSCIVAQSHGVMCSRAGNYYYYYLFYFYFFDLEIFKSCLLWLYIFVYIRTLAAAFRTSCCCWSAFWEPCEQTIIIIIQSTGNKGVGTFLEICFKLQCTGVVTGLTWLWDYWSLNMSVR